MELGCHIGCGKGPGQEVAGCLAFAVTLAPIGPPSFCPAHDAQ